METNVINLNGLALDTLIGVITSILGGFFTTVNMPSYLKQVIVLVISILLAVGRCYLTGDFQATNLAASIVTVAGSAWLAYQTITEKLAKELQTKGPIKDSGPAPALDTVTPIPVAVVPSLAPVVIPPAPAQVIDVPPAPVEMKQV